MDAHDPMAQLAFDLLSASEVPLAIFVWRNAPGWPVEYVGAGVEQVLGYGAAQFRAGEVAYRDLVHPDDLPRVTRELEQREQAGAGAFTHADYRVVHRDGRIRWVQDRAVIVRAGDGRATHCASYILERTLQAQTRQFVREALGARKTESLAALSAGIAHDFNNLLTVIRGNTEPLVAEVAPGSPAARRLERIRDATLEAAALVGRIQAYAGGSPLVIERLEVGALVLEHAAELEAAVPDPATLELDLTGDPLPIDGDPLQLLEVLRALLFNAAEATESDGRSVILGTSLREVTSGADEALAGDGPALPPGLYARVEVEDRGRGIRPGDLDRVFDPFFTTKFTGRGLGLAAAKGIVEAHRGRLRLSSTPGVGTTVEVLIPIAAQLSLETDRDGSQRLRVAAAERQTILFLAPAGPAREAARKLLSGAGFPVTTAADADAATRALRERAEAVAVIVVDVEGGELGGAISALRAAQPAIPILALDSGGSLEPGVGPVEAVDGSALLAAVVRAVAGAAGPRDGA